MVKIGIWELIICLFVPFVFAVSTIGVFLVIWLAVKRGTAGRESRQKDKDTVIT